MTTPTTQDTTDQISTTDTRKRIRLTLSNDCFLDEMVSIPECCDDDIAVLTQTDAPPVLTVDSPFAVVGKSRIQYRQFQIDSMFKIFESMLYCAHTTSRFMPIVSYLFLQYCL